MSITHTYPYVSLSPRVRAEMRASHAGETGAVWIYRGILFVQAFKGDRKLRTFAREHLTTEQQHLELFEQRLHGYRGSLLLLFWMIAGFITGALPALLGRDWVYYTIYRVESFVEAHYQQQIDMLDTVGNLAHHDIHALFTQCQRDEVEHKDEALAAMQRPPSGLLRAWGWLVGAGSSAAVTLAKRV